MNGEVKIVTPQNWPAIAKLISTAENHPRYFEKHRRASKAGKRARRHPRYHGHGVRVKSMVDELIRFTIDQPNKTIGDDQCGPSKRKTGGALLGDRIRMNSIRGERVYMRSPATPEQPRASSTKEAITSVAEGRWFPTDIPGNERHGPERHG